jgi:hypothetical protein
VALDADVEGEGGRAHRTTKRAVQTRKVHSPTALKGEPAARLRTKRAEMYLSVSGTSLPAESPLPTRTAHSAQELAELLRKGAASSTPSHPGERPRRQCKTPEAERTAQSQGPRGRAYI